VKPARRQRLATGIAVTALALLVASAALWLYVAVADDAAAFIPAVLIAAVVLFAWRAPVKAGILLLLFSPIGFFVALLGSTNLDPRSQVIEALVWLGGVPLVAGVLLIVASFLLPAAPDAKTSTN